MRFTALPALAIVASAALASACAASHRAPQPATHPVAPPAPAPAQAAAPEAPAAVETETETAETSRESEPAAESASAPAGPAPIEIHKGTRVLMFGDSMVRSGLGFYLEERIVKHGGTFIPVSKPNSTTLSWHEGRDLQELIARTRPDVVIIALASNELFIPNPRARIPDVRAIVARIGSRPCIWIGPPPWRPEKGILGVVRENAAPCRFFESSPLTLERQSDGIHPSVKGGKTWADAVWQAAFAE